MPAAASRITTSGNPRHLHMNSKPQSLAQERVTSETWLPPWTLAEHEARYRFAADYVRGQTVVDCACGNGMGAKVFLEHLPGRLYGFDADSSAVVTASQECCDSRASFACTEATSLPLEQASCDVFISLETIEHVQDDVSFIREVARVLRPGGLFVVSTPNRLVTNPGATISDKPWNPFHVREYTPADIHHLLQGYFETICECGQNPVSRVRMQLERCIGQWLHLKVPVLLNQLWKCRWFLFPGKKLHSVQVCCGTRDYEYLVFVCRRLA